MHTEALLKKPTSLPVDRPTDPATLYSVTNNRGIIDEPYDCSDPTCQDDERYISRLGLKCKAHVRMDCARLNLVGFTDKEVDELMRYCPCACRVPCTNAEDMSRHEALDVISWDFTTDGVSMDGFGWETANEGRTIRFVVEPSPECDQSGTISSSAEGFQAGTATAIISFKNSHPIFYVLSGMGEQLDNSYEKMEVRINGKLVGSSTSNAHNMECAAGPVSVKYATNPYIVEAGKHIIEVFFTSEYELVLTTCCVLIPM